MTEDGPGLTHWEGEPVGVRETLWGIPRLEAWTTLGSTNDRLLRLAAEGASPFTTVIAETQRAGRGRGGRSWASPTGLGLWMSVLLPAAAPAARLLTPLVVGLAVCRAVEEACPGLRTRVKWPNDVLVGPAKLCGILCEVAGETVVAGIGLNVAQAPCDFPPEVRETAVSLRMVGDGGRTPSRGRLAGGIVRQLRAAFERPVPRLEGVLATEFRERDALAGERVRIERGAAGGVVEGVARGVDPSGALLVETEGGGVRPVVAGTVRLVG